MPFLFEKLDIYNIALAFHRKNINLCCDKRFEGHAHLSDQLKRASLSIPLNIAEGNGRFHKNERKHFFLIARGSAFECIPLITLSVDTDRITEAEAYELRNDVNRISKMLSGLIKGTDHQKPDFSPEPNLRGPIPDRLTSGGDNGHTKTVERNSGITEGCSRLPSMLRNQ